MRRLDIRPRAQRDLVEFAAYLSEDHGSHSVGERFIESLVSWCERRCRNPALIGSVQPQWGEDIRAWHYKGLVLLVRYEADRVVLAAVFSAWRDARLMRLDLDD